jgi:thiol:disulfide interchange protein
VKIDGQWVANVKPRITKNEVVWPGLPIEEHSEPVTWTVPLTVPSGFSGPISIAVGAQVCKKDGSCIPVNEKITALLVGAPAGGKPAMQVAAEISDAEAEKTEGVTEFRNKASKVQWVGEVSKSAAPGSTVMLTITAKPDPTFHVYAVATDASPNRTNFVVTEKSGLKLGEPKPPSDPIVKTVVEGLDPVSYHNGDVTWTIPVEIGSDVTPGTKKIVGSIAYQACTDTSCLQPKALQFTARIDVSPTASAAASRPVRFMTAKLGDTLDLAEMTKWVDQLGVVEATSEGGASASAAPVKPATKVQEIAGSGDSLLASSPLSLFAILAMAVGGGLILNLMPGVLPVVGLKIMSFASQAGENRGKVLALNFAYTLGILVVFWALAALAIISTYSWGREWLGIEGQMSWGQQFQYFAFRYGVILLVFALALSFLGVWEIPLPGFVGGKSTRELQQKEGFSGAFFKGIFTTVLATPCSGPLLGTVFAYTLGKSAVVILSIFTAIGLGMALPYLLIAFFPPLIAFLPKPGAWMDTFKQLLGFLLLGTCVFIFTFFPDSDRVMVFASLIAVWFGCWIIGSVPGWETLPKRLTAWGGGIGIAAALCYFSMWATAPASAVIAWEPYDEVRLQQLRDEGRTVLIDFTAKWCITCQMNFKVAINTEETGRLINELNAVPMLADWTDHSEKIQMKLQELDSNSIPLLAIYPGGSPDAPIVLRDLVTQNDVLTALKQAGPSLATPRSAIASTKSPIAWENFDPARLKSLREEGRTVMINFMAKWDITGQVNQKFAIDTPETGRLIHELNVVSMLADLTEGSADVVAQLSKLDANSVPLLAIYPGGSPDAPIVLRDLVTQNDVFTALKQAGPSLTTPRLAIALLQTVESGD